MALKEQPSSKRSPRRLHPEDDPCAVTRRHSSAAFTRASGVEGGSPRCAESAGRGEKFAGEIDGNGSEDTTALLHRWARGNGEAGELLMARLYPDLRRLALHQRWDLDLSVQVSDLAQDLYLKLADQRRTDWQDRAHFFAIAAKLIRRIVIDHLRRRRRLKRGGEAERVELEEASLVAGGPDLDLLALDEALGRLAAISPSAVQVVELRFFAGLGVDETAAVLDVGRATVIRRWRFARAWLRDALGGGSSG